MSVFSDPGNISLVVQVIILFMLILGLPLARGEENKKNLTRHGYLTLSALIIHTAIVFAVMVFLALDDLLAITNLPLLSLVAVLSHITLGIVALVLGYIVVGFWLSKPIGNMNCYKARKIMLPLLVTWTVSLIIGAIIHFFEMF
jgi:hypothetical protein